MEGNTRKTSNHYGYQYQNSYTYSNGISSIYDCKNKNSITRKLPNLHEDYRPIYFYVAQPYTIPYTFAKRPKQSSLQKSYKQHNYRVKFSKKLSNAEFSQKVKQGEFSKSLNQVQFVNDTIPEIKSYPKIENQHQLKKKNLQLDPRMTSMFRRGTIFATFFLSLIGGGLVCTALVTQHWIEAKTWRTANPYESSGNVHYGLLQGKKELNVAYGLRTHHVSIAQMIKQDPLVMNWNLWIATLITTISALIASALSALLAVLNTATTPRSKIFSVPGVYLINTLTFLLCMTSAGTWLAQYFTKLYNNVLTKEDINNTWTSEGTAELGYSFWLVVCAGFVHVISISLVAWGSGRIKDERLETMPALEEKTAAAIMLY